MFKKIFEIIFPRKCGFCNILINEDYTCKKCEKNLEYICNNNILEVVENKNFDILVSSYFYTGIIRERILDFKFKNKKYLFKCLSEKLVENLQNLKYEIDCIIPVPISINRYFERGYNQSKLIAKFISEKINKPIYNYVLIKNKNNKKQSNLGVKERTINVVDVYKVINKNMISGKKILLVDDIYTTGATVDECSRVLKNNGSKKIIVATVAKANINRK